ncbi:MAG: YdeI/OmpD-associated family protein [Gemmatimonadota bacterium]
MPPRKSKPTPPDPPIQEFTSSSAWESWLRKHHARSTGLRIKFAKKGSGVASVTHAEALDVALCYGWIDGQTARIDGVYWLQRFTPRGPRSKWSKVNCDKASALIEAGRMQPAGHAAIEAARADGRWEGAYESQRTIAIPPDLRRRLDASPRAAKFFAGLDSKNRYAILYRLHDAKKPETRLRRLDKFVAMLESGETLHEVGK